jgi:hypothetical protein
MPIVICKRLEFKWWVLLSSALKMMLSSALKMSGSADCIHLARVIVEYKK